MDQHHLRAQTMHKSGFTVLPRRSDGDGARASIELDDVPGAGGNHKSRGFQQGTRSKLLKRFDRFPQKAFLLILGLSFALAAIVVFAIMAEYTSQSYLKTKACYPNGLYTAKQGATWRIMDSSYFFTPNLSFGKLNFTQAKVIDIAWDLAIGRGGQMLLGWVNYRVFNEWILFQMERHVTSYRMYTAIAFESTTLPTLGVLAKELLAVGQPSRARFFRWIAVLGMLLSALYVLSFPTLMAAMTGYLAKYEPYVDDGNGSLVDFDRLIPVYFVIWDSGRIGDYKRPLVATENDWELRAAVLNYIGRTAGDKGLIKLGESGEKTMLFSSGDDAVHQPNFFRNMSSVWDFNGEMELPAPSLNITMLHNVSVETTIETRTGTQRSYIYASEDDRQASIFTMPYINSMASCQPSDTYQWGFSYIFLFMVSIFNFVWSCIMVGMWVDTARASRVYKSGRRPGLLRNILDISPVLVEELGERTANMREQQLREAITDSGSALCVRQDELRIARTRVHEPDIRKRSWAQRLTKGSSF